MSRFRAHFLTLAVLLTFCICATLSFADTMDEVQMVLGPTDTGGFCTGSTGGASCAGYKFTSTWDPDKNLLTFTVQKTPLATQAAYFQGFSLSMFNPAGKDVLSTSILSGPSGFLDVANTKINNGGDTCKGSHDGTLCVENTASTGPLITSAGLTFDIQITGWTASDLMTSWDLLATGTQCPSGDQCGNTFALTNTGPTGPPPAVPEPSSLVLFGSGLLGFGSFLRRFRR